MRSIGLFQLVSVRLSNFEDMSKKFILSVLGGMLLVSVSIACVVQLRECVEKSDESGLKDVEKISGALVDLENSGMLSEASEKSSTDETLLATTQEVSSDKSQETEPNTSREISTDSSQIHDQVPFQPFNVIEAPIICAPKHRLTKDKNNKYVCKLVI